MALNKNCLEYCAVEQIFVSNFLFTNAVHLQIHVYIITKFTFIFALNYFTHSRKGLNLIIAKGLKGKSTSGD